MLKSESCFVSNPSSEQKTIDKKHTQNITSGNLILTQIPCIYYNIFLAAQANCKLNVCAINLALHIYSESGQTAKP